ncbi:MAG: glycosyltransferase family 2 protein [Lachnospiraceae bacterium]|nr:glycosyltransferase family 2 protein [Lachnospiraceae bacterium]
MLSVIVPVYNTELAKLRKCICSIVNQTYSDIEIIIVDDGSDMTTASECDQIALQDERIIVIHKNNEGVSAARNTGIDIARGDYVFFSDSDDYIDNMAFEKMTYYVEKKYDLVIAGYFFEIESLEGNSLIKQFLPSKVFDDRKSFLNNMIDLWDNSLMYNVWNKMFSLHIIKENGIQFPEGKSFNEDRDFIRDYLMYVDKCAVMEDCFYHYIREDDSAATGQYRENMLDIRKEEYHRLISFFIDIGIKDFNEYVSREHLDRVIASIENLYHGHLCNAEIKEKIHTILEDSDTCSCACAAIPKSCKSKILYSLVKNKNEFLLFWMMEIIYKIRIKYPVLFTKLRQSR